MAKNKSQYDSTLNLPKTLFEMRAGLPKKEPVMLKDWEDNDLYNQLIKHNDGKPKFVLHDGPPYANGNIHMGTALNKIIKDIIIRDKNMEGFQAPYVPGFDTHGLPIELKALSSVGEKKKDISKLELRQICEKFATEHIDIMSDQFKRLGVIGDFEHPYLTLKPEFEARQIEIFGERPRSSTARTSAIPSSSVSMFLRTPTVCWQSTASRWRRPTSSSGPPPLGLCLPTRPSA